jgi:antitoxin ParD1/3/4
MNVSVGKRWEDFIDALVKSGRYASATEVMREGLRLVEEREAKFNILRDTIEASLAEGGELTDEEVGAELRAHVQMRKTQAGKCAN